MKDRNTLLNELERAKQQMVYWARKTSDCHKRLDERDKYDAFIANNGSESQWKGSVAPRTSGWQRVRNDGPQDAGDGSGGL